jgi:hypothetical protein
VVTGGVGGGAASHSSDTGDRVAAVLVGALIGGLAGSFVGGLFKEETVLTTGTKANVGTWTISGGNSNAPEGALKDEIEHSPNHQSSPKMDASGRTSLVKSATRKRGT